MTRFKNLLVGMVLAFTALQVTAAPDVKSKLKAVPAAVISDSAVVRDGASDASSVIATLKKGDMVTATDRKGSYWKVKLSDGKEGFMSVSSLKPKVTTGTLKSTAASLKPAPSASPSPSATDTAKSNANAKVDDAKAKANDEAAKTENKAKDLEKSAAGFLNK